MIANGEERRKEAQKSALAMRARFSRGDLPPCPVAVTYALTPLGRTLLPVLETMAAWGERFRESAES